MFQTESPSKRALHVLFQVTFEHSSLTNHHWEDTSRDKQNCKEIFRTKPVPCIKPTLHKVPLGQPYSVAGSFPSKPLNRICVSLSLSFLGPAMVNAERTLALSNRLCLRSWLHHLLLVCFWSSYQNSLSFISFICKMQIALSIPLDWCKD